MYQLPNFTEPIAPDLATVMSFQVFLLIKQIRIEIALRVQGKTYIHTSDFIPFDGDWDKINIETIMNYELQKYLLK